MKKNKLAVTFAILIVIIIVGIFALSEREIESESIELRNVCVTDEDLVIKMAFSNSSKFDKYIGCEWSDYYQDGEKVISCVAYRKKMLPIRDDSRFSSDEIVFFIPMQKIQEDNISLVQYGKGDSRIIVWEKCKSEKKDRGEWKNEEK